MVVAGLMERAERVTLVSGECSSSNDVLLSWRYMGIILHDVMMLYRALIDRNVVF